MSHFSGHFEGASTFLSLNCPERSLGPLKMSLEEMAHKVIVPQKKIMSQSFLNSGTLVILCTRVLLCTVVVCCCVLLSVVGCSCVLEGCGGLLVAVLCEQVFRGRGLAGRAPPPPP